MPPSAEARRYFLVFYSFAVSYEPGGHAPITTGNGCMTLFTEDPGKRAPFLNSKQTHKSIEAAVDAPAGKHVSAVATQILELSKEDYDDWSRTD